jgi:hypothetical protein
LDGIRRVIKPECNEISERVKNGRHLNLQRAAKADHQWFWALGIPSYPSI